MPVNLNQYWGSVGTFNNRNYYHKSTFSLERTYQNTFFLNCPFPFCNISLLFVLLITVFLTLKSNSYRSTNHFRTLSFLVTIITIWPLPWLYRLLILLDVGSSEIGMFTNVVSITLQLAVIGFLPIGNPFIIKDAG